MGSRGCASLRTRARHRQTALLRRELSSSTTREAKKFVRLRRRRRRERRKAHRDDGWGLLRQNEDPGCLSENHGGIPEKNIRRRSDFHLKWRLHHLLSHLRVQTLYYGGVD